MSNVLVQERRLSKPCAPSKSASLRIAMVAARAFPLMGGIESHIHEVSSRLVEMGHDVTVLTTDLTGRLPRYETAAGVRIKRVPASPSKWDVYFAPAIYREVISGEFDIAHIQGYHTLVPPLGMLAAIRRRLPFVITFHSGGHSSPLRRAVRGIQWRTLAPLVRRASRHVGVSEFEANFFSKTMGVPRDKFTVIPNGAQLPAVHPEQTHPKKGSLIVSIGRLERYKGHHRAIEAMHKLQWRFPDARLMVLGSGPYEQELWNLVKKLRLTQKVTIGSLPPSERHGMASLLSSADLVVLLSDYEAHPVAVMEALSLGRKVLTSDTSGFIELAKKGLIRTVPLESAPIEVASAMAEALESRSQVAEFTLPSWDDCAGQLNEVYRAVTRDTVVKP